MKYLFLWLSLAAPAFADIKEALHLDNFDQTYWTDGTETLAFYTLRPKTKKERVRYRYGILKQDETIERGACMLSYAWREEMPYLDEGRLATNYFYQLTLHPDTKTARTAVVRFIFIGEGFIPSGFTDIKYNKIWRRTLFSGSPAE